MNNTVVLHERVEVVPVYCTSVDVSQICYPAKMKYQGQVIEFTELGLRHPTSKGKRMIHVFDMSDVRQRLPAGVRRRRPDVDAYGYQGRARCTGLTLSRH